MQLVTYTVRMKSGQEHVSTNALNDDEDVFFALQHFMTKSQGKGFVMFRDGDESNCVCLNIEEIESIRMVIE